FAYRCGVGVRPPNPNRAVRRTMRRPTCRSSAAGASFGFSQRRKSRNDVIGSLPLAFFGCERFLTALRDAVEAGLAVVFRNAPFRRDRALLLKLQEHWIKRSLVDREQLPARLFDPPCDAVSVLRAESRQRLQHHQSQCALPNVCFVGHSFGFQQETNTAPVGKQNKT